jgi:hypothetical protein
VKNPYFLTFCVFKMTNGRETLSYVFPRVLLHTHVYVVERPTEKIVPKVIELGSTHFRPSCSPYYQTETVVVTDSSSTATTTRHVLLLVAFFVLKPNFSDFTLVVPLALAFKRSVDGSCVGKGVASSSDALRSNGCVASSSCIDVAGVLQKKSKHPAFKDKARQCDKS